MNKMAFRIQRLRSLCHMVVILFIRRHIADFLRDPRILRITLVDHAIRSLNEAILVDARIAGQRVDQTDVRAFRCLDRAHSAVVRIVNIADLESGAVTGQTARAECGETSLMCQLAERVVLIHELGQLGGSEELLDCSCNRLDVDQCLRRNRIDILCLHTLADNSLQSGETDAELVLKQLTNCTDTAVSEVIDIILGADAVLKMHVIVDRSEDIFLRDVLRDQLVDALSQLSRKILAVKVLIQNLLQDRIVDELSDACVLLLLLGHIDPCADIDHHGGQNLNRTVHFLDMKPYVWYSLVLDLVSQLSCNDRTGLSDHLAGLCGCDILCELEARDAVAKKKFLIIFITAYLRKVIASRIEEQVVQLRLRRIHCERFTRADLFVQLEKTLCVIRSRVLCEASLDLRLITEHINDLLVRTYAEGTDQDGDRNLSCPVNTDIEDIIGICLVLEPCTSVRNDCAGVQLLTDLIMRDIIIDAGGTNELADNDSLGAIDDKGAGISHQRKITHEDLMFLDLSVFFVMKTDGDLKRRRIICVTLLALLD